MPLRLSFAIVNLVRNRMTRRVRHCVECPKCRTRYPIGFTPYRNGSYLLPMVPFLPEQFTLYCACWCPPVSSHWRSNELKICRVSAMAYKRGYGSAEEVRLVQILVPTVRSRRDISCVASAAQET
jgi:hypothetical protein